jgi:hypothetical protein
MLMSLEMVLGLSTVSLFCSRSPKISEEELGLFDSKFLIKTSL